MYIVTFAASLAAMAVIGFGIMYITQFILSW